MNSQNQHSGSGSGSSDEEGRPGPARLLSIQIVWGALLSTVIGYVAIAYLTIPPGEKPEDLGAFELVLALLALSTLSLSFVIPKKLLGKAIGNDDPEALSIEDLTARVFSPWIIRMAMTESAAVLGFVVAMGSRQPSKLLPFVVISALAMLTTLPTDRSLRLAARAAVNR